MVFLGPWLWPDHGRIPLVAQRTGGYPDPVRWGIFSLVLLLGLPSARAAAPSLPDAEAQAGLAAADAAKSLQSRRTPSGDAVLDSLRARFKDALTPERNTLLKVLSAGQWRCRKYRDGAWAVEDGAYSYRAPWFTSDEVREYDHPRRDDRPYLGYRITDKGLAAMYGFLWLRVIDGSTLIKEYSDNSGAGTGMPSLVIPEQTVRWYTLCERFQ